MILQEKDLWLEILSSKYRLTTNCFDRENHNYVKKLKGYQREENMILIFKRTVQIAIKNLAVFVLLLVNISFKFWWYFFQMISFQHLTVCKVRQLEELCGDCLNIWGLVVFSFNFHESSGWHVLHQEQIVFCNGKSDFLFALWQLVGVDSYWAVWHLESLLRCCCVLLILRASRGRSETSQRYDDVYERGVSCKQDWKKVSQTWSSNPT